MENKFNHKEAYCWMYYQNHNGTTGYWIYNSRDGVTPFCVTIGGQEFTHVQWQKDLLARDYVPKKGDLIWRRLTRQEAESVMRNRIDKYPQYAVGREDEIIKEAGDDAENEDHPTLAIVSENGDYLRFSH